MNRLPEDVLDTIYKYKHQLEYAKVMEELIQHKINCRFNVTIDMITYMFYVNEDGVRIYSVDVSSIDVSAFQILNRIRNKSYYNIILCYF
jgi:hypothetical protein